jgi:acyl-coenzyme A synthetase/AMP-(fatty) acid ligase
MCKGAITTADLGYLDERGWLNVVGRVDDVIVTGGEKVHPNVVEDALAAGPGVREVCVIGVGDPRWGQRVVALVVLAPGTDLDLVIADARERLAPHQRPREWRVVANLPHTASGKVDRRTVTSA